MKSTTDQSVLARLAGFFNVDFCKKNLLILHLKKISKVLNASILKLLIEEYVLNISMLSGHCSFQFLHCLCTYILNFFRK